MTAMPPTVLIRAGVPVEALLSQEWLVTNGLGGYASGTLAGVPTRRFHGILIAALPAPLGRLMMLNHLDEVVRHGDTAWRLDGDERPDAASAPIHFDRAELRLEMGLPVWTYVARGLVIEKRIVMPHLQNTTHITYRVLAAEGPVDLTLRPWTHFRPHEGRVDGPITKGSSLSASGARYEIHGPPEYPPLRVLLVGGQDRRFVLDEGNVREVLYWIERARGYDHRGELGTPGFLHARLQEGEAATLVVSTEDWERIDAMSPDVVQRSEQARRERLIASAHPAARSGTAGDLVFAADQFIITPTSRVTDATYAHAAGDEPRTVIAGYHWFTDWGRDTMISLEGLTLITGRHAEAGYILRTFARYVKNGLLPNLFPEGGREGLYHTADASLWFFHAVARYVGHTGDHATLELLLPTLRDIVDHHLAGTLFGIGVDPADGLLRQGAPGYQLTWMDAKVDDWVVTPRRGKAVEINALFYNALCLLAGWLRVAQGDEAARPYFAHAARVQASFNARFWSDRGWLYDVVDCEAGGDDASLRPNQILAVSLEHAVLDPARWRAVVETVESHLLTPVGLRSLAPGEPDYKAKYDGDLRARDAAYHQGTVWTWLIGPFVDAWLKVHPGDVAGGRKILGGFAPHLQQGCLGTISEIFDAEPPFTQRGCVAQAWSVAEVLRCLVQLEQVTGPA